MTTYTIDKDDLTILATDDAGEPWNLNGGDACEDLDALREFVRESCEQGAFGADIRDRLLSDCEALHHNAEPDAEPCQHESVTTADGHGAYCKYCGETL